MSIEVGSCRRNAVSMLAVADRRCRRRRRSALRRRKFRHPSGPTDLPPTCGAVSARDRQVHASQGSGDRCGWSHKSRSAPRLVHFGCDSCFVRPGTDKTAAMNIEIRSRTAAAAHALHHLRHADFFQIASGTKRMQPNAVGNLAGDPQHRVANGGDGDRNHRQPGRLGRRRRGSSATACSADCRNSAARRFPSSATTRATPARNRASGAPAESRRCRSGARCGL